jgi:anhydro-N-acetylmuramic acid kinase
VVRTKVTFEMDSTAIIGVGLMCGTSQDGLDLVVVKFTTNSSKIDFEILFSKAFDIPSELALSLMSAERLNGLELSLLNNEVGRFFGNCVNQALTKTEYKPDFLASHGITIFHQPEHKLTLQIGSGAEIASITNIKTICDFRSTDLALGGNGAPLVPFADSNLFSKYDYSLNLGGFANIASINSEISGFDVTVCNLALNNIVAEIGLNFDNGGHEARKGSVNSELLASLNNLAFFKQKGPKSLGKEWFEREFLPIVQNSKISMNDKLRTVCEHIGMQLGSHFHESEKTCLVTGGGTYNLALIDAIKSHSKCKIELPDRELIDFKEAICFAFLGLNRLLEKQNISKTVTGAKLNSIGGAIYLPPLAD